MRFFNKDHLKQDLNVCSFVLKQNWVCNDLKLYTLFFLSIYLKMGSQLKKTEFDLCQAQPKCRVFMKTALEVAH